MSDRVQFVITAQEWDPSFEEVGPQGQGKGEPACPRIPCNLELGLCGPSLSSIPNKTQMLCAVILEF